MAVNETGCGFDIILRSGNEAERGDKFYHSMRNASGIWWKVGNLNWNRVLKLGSRDSAYLAMCGIQGEAKKC